MRDRDRPESTSTDAAGLRGLFRRLDGQPYSRYRQLVGRHLLDEFEVWIDRVPPDPFAGGARARLVIDRGKAKLPEPLVANERRLIAVAVIARRRDLRVDERHGSRSGLLWVCGLLTKTRTSAGLQFERQTVTVTARTAAAAVGNALQARFDDAMRVVRWAL